MIKSYLTDPSNCGDGGVTDAAKILRMASEVPKSGAPRVVVDSGNEPTELSPVLQGTARLSAERVKTAMRALSESHCSVSSASSVRTIFSVCSYELLTEVMENE